VHRGGALDKLREGQKTERLSWSDSAGTFSTTGGGATKKPAKPEIFGDSPPSQTPKKRSPHKIAHQRDKKGQKVKGSEKGGGKLLSPRKNQPPKLRVLGGVRVERKRAKGRRNIRVKGR